MSQRDVVSQLRLLWECRYPLILIETHDEVAAFEQVQRFCQLDRVPCFAWSAADGLCRPPEHKAEYNTQSLDDALKHIDASPQNGLFVLLDPHPYLDDPVTLRRLREVVQEHHRADRAIVLIAPELNLPGELAAQAARLEIPGSTRSEIQQIVKDEAARHKRDSGETLRADEAAYQLLIQYLTGTPLPLARRLVRQAMRDDGQITRDDLTQVLKQKQASLGSDILGFEFPAARLDEVGGLTNLKQWLSLRRRAFIQADAEASVEAPRGMLLLGVQGAGKSFAAKAVAGSWGVPLLRLDMGTLFNKFFGETERNLRQALATAETMAPCVLWVDEIEKGLASDADGGTDGGVSRRVLGTLLTWLNERPAPVFLVATANDVRALPPELMRKGRFDELFFVDLPDGPARAAIFRVHLSKRKQPLDRFDLLALAQGSDGYSGAEIEASVRSALLEAHAAERSLDQPTLLATLAATKPLSVLRAEELDELRAWARSRTVPA
ncbi:AAA family ATPase [Chitinolyticbacter albus]|uniref:AAA family ATPase n=1 Tax=Chitinolyticbacter albus TaxID=2961951 RepID=UPI00210B4DC7|nr:AAA family ATPase [Chitinolyticbacter albus]